MGSGGLFGRKVYCLIHVLLIRWVMDGWLGGAEYDCSELKYVVGVSDDCLGVGALAVDVLILTVWPAD